jgi:hypothetical protein
LRFAATARASAAKQHTVEELEPVALAGHAHA